MPRTRMTNVSAAQWSPNGGAMGRSDLTQAGAYAFGENVFSPAIQRQRLSPACLQAPAGDAGQRAAAGCRAGGRHRDRDEGMGDGARLHALHALVPAAHRLHGREARLVLQPDRRRQRAGGVLRQGADPGRAGRLLVPDRRDPGDVRGARLHRVGSLLAGLHPREPERRAALHPDRVRVVDRRGARPQDPAAALDGRALALGAAHAAAARQRGRDARVHDDRARAGVLPDRRELLLRAPRPRHDRPHAVRRQAGQGARARRPLLRLDPGARARLHARRRARDGAARDPDQDAPQRGRAGPVRVRPGVRELQRRLRPPAALHAAAAERGAPLPAGLPAAREAVRRRQRLGQAQQLVVRDRHRGQPARAGRHAAREPAVPVLLLGRAARGRHAPGAAARIDRLARAGPPPGRERGAAGDHLDLPRRRAAEGLRRDRERLGRRGDAVELPQARRQRAAAPADARRRSQPHLAVRLHRQQVRVPRARLVGFVRPPEHGAQHDRRAGDRSHVGRAGGAARGRRRAGRGGARRRQGGLRRAQADRVQRRQLHRGVARRGRGSAGWRTCRRRRTRCPR